MGAACSTEWGEEKALAEEQPGMPGYRGTNPRSARCDFFLRFQGFGGTEGQGPLDREAGGRSRKNCRPAMPICGAEALARQDDDVGCIPGDPEKRIFLTLVGS